MTNAHAVPTAPPAAAKAAGPRLSLVESPADTAPAPSRTAEWLVRRLALAFFDLGLAGTVPAGWARADGEGISFAPLDVRRADRLVRELENLVGRLPEPAPVQAGDGQLAFPFGDD